MTFITPELLRIVHQERLDEAERHLLAASIRRARRDQRSLQGLARRLLQRTFSHSGATNVGDPTTRAQSEPATPRRDDTIPESSTYPSNPKEKNMLSPLVYGPEANELDRDQPAQITHTVQVDPGATPYPASLTVSANPPARPGGGATGGVA